MALLSVETVEHEKLSPQATGTQECQRGRVCSVWPHGATGEASSFRELGQHAEQTHSKELRAFLQQASHNKIGRVFTLHTHRQQEI